MAATGAANSETFKVTTPTDTEIHFTRLFNAPTHLVFEAMSKPEHITQWWGNIDEGYSVPVCEVDFRPGGKWRFVNRTPRGQLVAFYGVYREIAAPERVVFTEIFEQFPDTESVVTSVLTEEHGKTRLTATVRYPSREIRDMVLGTGMARGAAISYDHLEAVAARLKARS